MRAKKAPPPNPHTRNLFAAAALCAITLLAFSNSFQAGFAFDNKGLILQVPQIREATPQNIASIFQHSYWWPLGESGLYRPFTTLSYLFNYAVLGDRDQPAGYHWINLILHLGNVLLVFALALKLIRTFWPSVFIASLWAVHPVLTESVTNIVGRADLLSAMAVLSGFLMYLKSTEAEGGRRWAWLAGLMAATTIGVFSKESAVAILGVLLLYELTFWKERKQARGLLLGCAAILPPLAAMLLQRSYVLRHSSPAVFPFTDNPIVGAGFWQGKLTALAVLSRYLLKVVWPATLSSDYSYPQIPLARGSAEDWLAWAVVAAAAAGVVLLYRSNRTAFFLACFAIVNFAPASNLLFPIGTIMAERLLYVPSIGLLACLVLGLCSVLKSQGRQQAVVALILAAFVLRTRDRNLDWQDDLTLSTSAVRASPRSYKAHRLLALTLFESTPPEVDRAIEEVEKSIALLDPLPDSLNKTDPYLLGGMLYIAKGDRMRQSPQGPQLYQRGLQIALRAQPIVNRQHAEDPSGYQLLSALYLRLGDLDNALDTGIKARSRDPFKAQIHQQVAYVLIAKHRVEDAAVALAEGLTLTSDPGLRDELLNLYQQGLDPKGCAIAPGPAINPSCETVRRHFCAASVETIQASLRAGRRDLAESEKKSFVGTYGCPAGPLDRALPGS